MRISRETVENMHEQCVDLRDLLYAENDWVNGDHANNLLAIMTHELRAHDERRAARKAARTEK